MAAVFILRLMWVHSAGLPYSSECRKLLNIGGFLVFQYPACSQKMKQTENDAFCVPADLIVDLLIWEHHLKFGKQVRSKGLNPGLEIMLGRRLILD